MKSNSAWDPWNYSSKSGYSSTSRQDLKDFDVEATDGGIGHIDEATNQIGRSYIVVDTGPWIFGRKVMLPAGVIERVDAQEKKVYINCTKGQVKDSPELNEGDWESEARRNDVGGYYGGFYQGNTRF